jgi:rhodanese-related sulfurtransferase
MEKIFNDVSDLRHVLVVCYNGDSARVATSVLRAKGLEADSVRGGYGALKMFIEERVVGKSLGTTVSVQAVPLG